MIEGLEAIVDKKSTDLILGSMPGEESLRKGEYYAFKHNHFWQILFTLFEETLTQNYEEKKKFILQNNLALWDVIKNCEREGSLDSSIKNPLVNDFNTFFFEYPSIQRVFFNGKMAEKLFKKFVLKELDGFKIKLICLPSTSPANTIGIDKKLMEWSQIIKE